MHNVRRAATIETTISEVSAWNARTQPPDFAVEVVSPGDLKNKSERINKKLKAYQDARVPLLWYVYPDRKEVQVYTLDQEKQTVTKDGVLDGGDVLPGFRLPVAEIFR